MKLYISSKLYNKYKIKQQDVHEQLNYYSNLYADKKLLLEKYKGNICKENIPYLNKIKNELEDIKNWITIYSTSSETLRQILHDINEENKNY